MVRIDPRPVSGEFGFPLGGALAVVVTFVAVAAGATHHVGWAVVALAGTIAIMAAITTAVATFGTAVVSWFLVAGFVIGRAGQVSVTPAAGRAALVLLLTAVGACGVAGAVRWALGHALPTATARARPGH